jgi:aspartyl-tRNA(Asn)/glutamyl-tRNA(Gln) amidotransferase subunit A
VAEAFNAAVAAGRALNAYTVEFPEVAPAAAEEADKARAAGPGGQGKSLGCV